MSNMFSLADIPYLLYPMVPMRWMYPCVRLQARLMHSLRGKESSVVRNNFVDAFGETKSQGEIDDLTRQFYEYKQLRMLLMYLLPKLKSAQREKLVPIEGIEHLDRALSEEKGAILSGAHLSSVMTLFLKDSLRACVRSKFKWV